MTLLLIPDLLQVNPTPVRQLQVATIISQTVVRRRIHLRVELSKYVLRPLCSMRTTGHLACNRIHSTCNSTPLLYQLYTQLALHHYAISSTPLRCQLYTLHAPFPSQICTTEQPALHHFLTNSTPLHHQLCNTAPAHNINVQKVSSPNILTNIQG